MKQLLAVSLAAFGLTTSTTVRVTPADGRRLAEQAFAQDGDPRYTLVLAPGPEAFKIAGDRVTLSATATLHFGVDFTCPVRISGRPVIRGNRVGLKAPDITSDDWGFPEWWRRIAAFRSFVTAKGRLGPPHGSGALLMGPDQSGPTTEGRPVSDHGPDQAPGRIP